MNAAHSLGPALAGEFGAVWGYCSPRSSAAALGALVYQLLRREHGAPRAD